MFTERHFNSLAGLLDESNSNEDSLPQEDDSEKNDCLCYRYDYHCSRKTHIHTHELNDYLLHTPKTPVDTTSIIKSILVKTHRRPARSLEPAGKR